MLDEHEDDPVLAGSTDEDLHNLAERWVTVSFDRIATYRDWEWLKGTISLTWPASGILYLPNYVERLCSPIVSALGQPEVNIVQASEFDRYRDRITDNYLVNHGYYGVEADMPSATTITATSASGASANTLQVRIEGLTTDTPGYEQVVTLTLAGAGTATTSQSWKAAAGGVRSINIVPGTVPTAGQGILTVTGGGVTLERLDASRERAHQHIRTELHMATGASSSSSNTLTCRYIRKAFNVTVSTDLIPIPDSFHDLMEIGIQVQCALKFKEAGTAAMLRAEWKERMREFSAWNNRQYGNQRSIVAPRIMSER